MKKFISLLLALLMVFSVATVAFAAEGDAEDPATTVDAQDEGAEDTDPMEIIMDMPVGTAKALLKVGKIVLKLVKVFVKVGLKLGLIDSDELIQQVADMFGLDADSGLPLDQIKDAAQILI